MHKNETFNQNQNCNEQCPVKKTADLIEGKWTTLLIRELLAGKRRYSELQRGLPGISPKILTARLRFLEQKKLIHRSVFPTIPPTTEYELTKAGRGLEKVIQAMAAFGSEINL